MTPSYSILSLSLKTAKPVALISREKKKVSRGLTSQILSHSKQGITPANSKKEKKVSDSCRIKKFIGQNTEYYKKLSNVPLCLNFRGFFRTVTNLYKNCLE
jgi:hypothetical protein